jgi:arylsulfatase A-like enzyme
MRAKISKFGLYSAVAAVLLLLWGGCAKKTPELVAVTDSLSFARQSDEKPNLVLILAHQLGHGDLGCYGQKFISTPNIDRLAEEGCRFTHAYAGGDSADATLWTLMTGHYAAHAVQDGRLTFQLKRDQRTLATVMQSNGYATGFVGCWNLGGGEEATLPDSHGFDEWSGLVGAASAESAYPMTAYSDGEYISVAENAGGKPGIGLTEILTLEALAFLEKHQSEGKPFLLVLSYPLPGVELPLAESGAYANSGWTAAQVAHAERISRLDSDVGRLVERLKELGLAQRTAVFLTSDSAPQPAGTELEMFDSLKGLRTSGGDMYEGRLRVPLVVHWPAEASPGLASEFAVTPWDLLPTFTDLAGATLPAGASDGVSFVPALLGDPSKRRSMLYWETRDKGFGQGVRIGDWKAVRPCGKMELDAVELYNLIEDPTETNNQAQQHPEILSRFIRN